MRAGVQSPGPTLEFMRAVILCVFVAAPSHAKSSADAPARDGWNSFNTEAQAVMSELHFQDDARRTLELRVPRQSDDASAENEANTPIEADEPYVPPLASSSAEEALGRLRAALDEGRVEAALAEAYDFRQRYPARPENGEVDLAAGALHLRRGEASRAVRFLKPLAEGDDPELKSKALHLIGAALASLGLDEATLKLVPEVDAAGTTNRWLALAQIWRAAAEQRIGLKDEAAEHYRAVSASGHHSPVKAYALAAIAADWDSQGRADRARDTLLRAGDEAEKWGLLELRESIAMSEANILLRSQKLDEAERAYAKFSANFSGSLLRAQALYQRGLCLKKLSRPEDAAGVFEDLALRYPASAYAADAHLQLGQLYTELGKSERALEHYRQMGRTSEAKEAEREALLLMAQVHYNKKRWAEAIPLYKKYLGGSSAGTKTKEIEGLLLVATWQNNKEDPELPALVLKYPNHQLAAQIRWELSVKAYKQQDWDAAERLFRKHIEDNPHDVNSGAARFYQAESLRQLRRNGEAVDAYGTFLKLHPRHPRARAAAMSLGALLYEAGNMALAAAAYAQVGGTDADAANAAYNRAMALSKIAKDLNAERAWRGFAAKFPAHEKASWAWAQIAKLREDRVDLEGAASAYARAAGGNERLKALYALGRVQERRKKMEEAKNAYGQLRALSPQDDSARLAGLLRLGLLLELEDKSKEAAPLYLEVLKCAQSGSAPFETARKRLESLSGDKSLMR